MCSDLNAASPLCLAYYCSGHGYGHATRVSAFARYLLSVREEDRPIIYIVSSAPQHVFSDSISCGARYRYAEIDPVIVQPLAYRVDRRKSVDVLKKFLAKKDELLERERNWLLQVNAQSVLSDAAFLGCLAAKATGLPSVLITNFSFDSVYSYLSIPLVENSPHSDPLPSLLDMVPDVPIPHAELAPLVEQIHAGYRCADLLVRLPGYIPMPSFFIKPPLPSFEWVDVRTRRLRPEIMHGLATPCEQQTLHPSLPFLEPKTSRKGVERMVLQAPLLVRPPSSEFSVYTPEGRSRLLASIGIPPDLHDPIKTKILIVSFGGQIFRRPTPSPSRASSRVNSRNTSRENLVDVLEKTHLKPFDRRPGHALKERNSNEPGTDISRNNTLFLNNISPTHFDLHIPSVSNPNGLSSPITSAASAVSRIATPCHLWIPGAPPASKPSLSQPSATVIPTLNTIPPTPQEIYGFEDQQQQFEDVDAAQLLPDASWIAVVCGVSKEQWNNQNEDDSELPDGFYVAPRDVYMPDLTAVADVLLGKLGYGTVSECVDACTPFVYVSRPLFIEEHGLRILLDQEGVGVELSRQSYEAGDWAFAVSEAFAKGKEMKKKKSLDMAKGIDVDKREVEGKKLAGAVVEWVRAWQSEAAQW